jgi:hypothetical protein
MMAELGEPGQGLEFGVDLAAAKLDPQDINQLLAHLNVVRVERKRLAKRSLSSAEQVMPALDSPGHEAGLNGHGVTIGNVTERIEGLAVESLTVCNLGAE